MTGAGAGIGAAAAVALLAAGYHVALAGRREQALRDTAGDRPNALVVPTDVAVEEQVARVMVERLAISGSAAGADTSSLREIAELLDADWLPSATLTEA